MLFISTLANLAKSKIRQSSFYTPEQLTWIFNNPTDAKIYLDVIHKVNDALLRPHDSIDFDAVMDLLSITDDSEILKGTSKFLFNFRLETLNCLYSKSNNHFDDDVIKSVVYKWLKESTYPFDYMVVINNCGKFHFYDIRKYLDWYDEECLPIIDEHIELAEESKYSWEIQEQLDDEYQLELDEHEREREDEFILAYNDYLFEQQIARRNLFE